MLQRYVVKDLAEAREVFTKYGFCIIEGAIPKELQERVKSRFDLLFAGKFETGIFPDEWHWREGISKANVTREIVNAWKADYTVASVVLHSELGRIASGLLGWEGARIAQDDVIYKPRNSKSSTIGFHRDGVYISQQFVPEENNSVTCWMPLSDVSVENGTIEYAIGSHKWPKVVPENLEEQTFHGTVDYRDSVRTVANKLGVGNVQFYPVKTCAGSIVFHHQDIWHGSSANISKEQDRYTIVSHLLSSSVEFIENPDYIYGRYKICGTNTVSDSFFPIVWPEELRSKSIYKYRNAKEMNHLKSKFRKYSWSVM